MHNFFSINFKFSLQHDTSPEIRSHPIPQSSSFQKDIKNCTKRSFEITFPHIANKSRAPLPDISNNQWSYLTLQGLDANNS